MPTSTATRSVDRRTRRLPTVVSPRECNAAGLTIDEVRAHVAAHRWQRVGRAVLRHNGLPTQEELRRAALINCGPRAVLTAFSSLEDWGLRGWERLEIHVLVPRGARVRRAPGLPLRVHYTDDWRPQAMHLLRRLHRPAPAAVLAASTFPTARPACGLLAAAVQQRLVRPDDLLPAVAGYTRIRHRAALVAAAGDIGQGAQALSEIDFARLCRSAGLPEPVRQAVRRDRNGRRRYLDVEWRRRDGRRVIAEIDGALHLAPTTWWADQLRQNDLAIADDVVLRYPSVIVRLEPALVLGQLTRALLLA